MMAYLSAAAALSLTSLLNPASVPTAITLPADAGCDVPSGTVPVPDGAANEMARFQRVALCATVRDLQSS